jgi:hypothetical protein
MAIIGVLRNFVRLSGLHLNPNKSGFAPIAIPLQHVETVNALLGCQLLQLSITYLGLPLTHLKPTTRLFDPLVVAVQCRLQGHAKSNLSLAGRVIILNAILNALPSYYMQVFRPP